MIVTLDTPYYQGEATVSKPKKPPTWNKLERDLLKYLLRLNYGPSLKKRIPRIVK